MTDEQEKIYKERCRRLIKDTLYFNDMSQAKLAQRLGLAQSGLNEKINRGTMKFIDVLEILEMFGETLQKVKIEDINKK